MISNYWIFVFLAVEVCIIWKSLNNMRILQGFIFIILCQRFSDGVDKQVISEMENPLMGRWVATNTVWQQLKSLQVSNETTDQSGSVCTWIHPFLSVSVLIGPSFSLSTSSNKSDVPPVFVFYSLSSAGLNFKVPWQGPLGSGTKGEKISHDGQDHRGFYTCLCVVIESLPMDSPHIHFVLRSPAFLPAAFIFSFVPINTTFSVWLLISHGIFN